MYLGWTYVQNWFLWVIGLTWGIDTVTIFHAPWKSYLCCFEVLKYVMKFHFPFFVCSQDRPSFVSVVFSCKSSASDFAPSSWKMVPSYERGIKRIIPVVLYGCVLTLTIKMESYKCGILLQWFTDLYCSIIPNVNTCRFDYVRRWQVSFIHRVFVQTIETNLCECGVCLQHFR